MIAFKRETVLAGPPTDNYFPKHSVWGLKGAGIFFERGCPKYTRVINFGKNNRGVITFFDDQNVGSYKMTTESVFLFCSKKTNFNTILVCLGVRCFGDGGSYFFSNPSFQFLVKIHIFDHSVPENDTSCQKLHFKILAGNLSFDQSVPRNDKMSLIVRYLRRIEVFCP